MSNKKTFEKQRLSTDEYASGIISGNRVILSQAITLIESKLQTDNDLAESLIELLLPHTGKSLRIGITGVPGSGKSTFIESFGKLLTSLGKKVAVLSIDPTSQLSKGSILGDKTRMEELANDPKAYIRPSPSGNTLGGVHSRTRETILLCEACGFDVVIVETVGVGQSEVAVRGIVDFFLLITLSGAGDELQGIKRGIMEMADAIVVNKSDGDNIKKAQQTRQDYVNALHMFPPASSGWIPQVHTCSALYKEGLEEIWQMIEEYESQTRKSGYFLKNRQNQNLQWMKDILDYQLKYDFFHSAPVTQNIGELEKQVKKESIPAHKAARILLKKFRENH